MAVFLQCLVDGLFIGSIYALIAIGYTMVYGILKLINFVHGELYMFSALLAYYFFEHIKNLENNKIILFISALLLVILITVCLGVLVEKIVYKPLRKSNKIYSLMTSFATALLLQNICLKIFGSEVKTISIDTIPLKIYKFQIGEQNVIIKNYHIISIVLSIFLIVLLYLIIRNSKIGKAVRAASFDEETSKLMGINFNNMVSLVFAIASSLAAIGAVLYIVTVGEASPVMGTMTGIKAFIAVLLGGAGSIPGALLGGIIIGVSESFLSEIAPFYKDILIFIIFLIFILLKPIKERLKN